MSNIYYSISGTILMLSIKVHKINKSCLLFLVLFMFYVCCLLTKSCLSLCNPMDANPPGSSVHGLSQTRILEWVAILFSRNLPHPGIRHTFPTLSSGFFITEPPIQFSWPVMSDFLWSSELQYARLPCPSPTPGVAQTHVHGEADAIRPSHPLSPPSSPVFNLSQHQSIFQWVSSSHQVAIVLEFQLQHQSFQWTPRNDLSGGR